MLSKSQIKFIKGLHLKKNRDLHGVFVAEGIKTIKELLQSNIKLEALYTTSSFGNPDDEVLIDEKILKQISFLKSPNTALAIFKQPESKSIATKGLIIALDAVRDPGNLGTIIRLCDWFGVSQLVCSTDTADCFNPKVIQATMGSISRIQITYTNLEAFLQHVNLPVFGTFMDGDNVYKTKLPNEGVLVLGNEANGISEAIENLVTQKVAIPQFGTIKETESLNVATATSIFLSEFRRSSF